MDSMKELYEKVAGDSTLQEKFAATLKEAQNAGKEEAEAKLVAFAKEAGYDVTIEELQEFMQEEAKRQKNEELEDSALDLVAGGKMMGSQFFTAAVISLASFGIACYVISVVGDLDGNASTDCGTTFESL